MSRDTIRKEDVSIPCFPSEESISRQERHATISHCEDSLLSSGTKKDHRSGHNIYMTIAYEAISITGIHLESLRNPSRIRQRHCSLFSSINIASCEYNKVRRECEEDPIFIEVLMSCEESTIKFLVINRDNSFKCLKTGRRERRVLWEVFWDDIKEVFGILKITLEERIKQSELEVRARSCGEKLVPHSPRFTSTRQVNLRIMWEESEIMGWETKKYLIYFVSAVDNWRVGDEIFASRGRIIFFAVQGIPESIENIEIPILIIIKSLHKSRSLESISIVNKPLGRSTMRDIQPTSALQRRSIQESITRDIWAW
jgi:hypothetical protein